jgi:hypothetical protein
MVGQMVVVSLEIIGFVSLIVCIYAVFRGAK